MERPRRAKLGHSDQKPKMKDFLFCAGNGKKSDLCIMNKETAHNYAIMPNVRSR